MDTRKFEIKVQNVDCPNEARAIKNGFETFAGIRELEIETSLGAVKVAYDPKLTSEEKIKEKLVSLGFPPKCDGICLNPPQKSPSVTDSGLSPKPGEKKVDIYVAHLDCENEAGAIDRGLKGIAGLTNLKVYPKAAKVSLTFNPKITTEQVLREKLADLGFPPQKGSVLPSAPKLWRNPKVITSTASGLLLLTGYFVAKSDLPSNVSSLIYWAAIALGGYYFVREGLGKLIHKREVGIELLMSVAAIVSALMGEMAEGAILVFLYSMSEAAEGYTGEKTRSAIKALMDLTPKMALVRRGQKEMAIGVEELAVGDIFIVKPGETVATDGELFAGSSSVNQSPVTGESVPVPKGPSDTVFAGSINGEGVIEVRATKTTADNTIARIIHMVQEAQEQKGKNQRFIERFGARYSPIVLLAGILLAIIPPLIFSASWQEWITRATVLIVAAAPCALVISIPIALVATLGTAARHGVLIKGGVHVEELAKIKVIALDKTGTITKGTPEVTDIIPCNSGKQTKSIAEILELAASLERRSQHPLASAVVKRAQKDKLNSMDLVNVKSITGFGISGSLDNKDVYAGSPELFRSRLKIDISSLTNRIEDLQRDGKTVILVGESQSLWGLIAIRDNVRDNVRKIVADLHASGIDKVVMLTGDNARTAQAIAQEVGIDEVYADLKPEDKVARIRELALRYGHVAMVGDGVNDAPALAEANVGIAMGAAGTDIALETADVALMADDLGKLVYAVNLARRNNSVVRQNVALSAVVISVLIVGAVLGFFTLPVAVVAHELSEFLVIGSGLRMLRS